MKKYISVVAPFFNEELNVAEFLNRVSKSLSQITENYEIILVDDGSSDDTWLQISKLSKSDDRIKAIRFSRNFGHHYAITAGLKASSGNWTIVMDSDLQDEPENFSKLVAEAEKGFDTVFVNRTSRNDSTSYLILQRLFYILLNILSGLKFDSRQANFSIISNKVLEAYNNFEENSRFYVSTIKWLGFSTSTIDAKHGSRFKGSPSYSIKKRFKLAFDVIISFSERPLKFAIITGTIFSTFSMFIMAIIINKALRGDFSVAGWPSLIATILFCSGIILLVLGIVGIYIGKIFTEVKRRSLYITSEKINL